jgi:tRNA(Arg) A34 adenosine deaminase TadA
MRSKKQHNITAIIYDRKGRELSIGKNSYIKTHPLQAKYAEKAGEEYKVFLHAEIHAITRCKDMSLAHKIVVMRFTEDGKPAPAKPCKVCQRAILDFKIKYVEHT